MGKLREFHISVFIDKGLLEHYHSRYLLSAYIFGCFLSKMADLSGCDRDYLAYKA